MLAAFEHKTIKAVQHIAGKTTKFKEWFEALDYMKSVISNIDLDIFWIGAGAHGFPLADYVKRLGKKALAMGGSLQLLFGIKGKKWENPNFYSVFNYSRLMNKYWVTAD